MSLIVTDPYARRKQIEAALAFSGGTHSMDDVADAVEAGRMQFWAGPNSAIVTEILTTPQKKMLNFFLAGGDLSELEAMYPEVERWGAKQGCTAAVFTGRKGWERTFLARKGWTPRLVVFEKELVA